MTQLADSDAATTIELVRQRDSDATWLRHRGRAAELDRRLLQGASEAELAEVRQSWKGHLRHLSEVHRLQVAESPVGFWRIVGVDTSGLQTDAEPLEDAAETLGNDDDYGDGNVTIHQPNSVSAHDNLRLRETAQALAALAKEKLLGNELLKASVSMLVRQASESRHWHACAHYRSKAAAQMIREARISSVASYQAFCSQSLRHEHVVPIAVIYRMLCKAEDTSVEWIAALLSRFSLRATITRDEDRELNKRGLSSAMPEAFYTSGSALHGNPMARYIAAKLDDQLEQRPFGKLWHDIN
jgi:hypothetical protein